MLMGRAPWEYVCMNANPFFFSFQISPSSFKNVQNNKNTKSYALIEVNNQCKTS